MMSIYKNCRHNGLTGKRPVHSPFSRLFPILKTDDADGRSPDLRSSDHPSFPKPMTARYIIHTPLSISVETGWSSLSQLRVQRWIFTIFPILPG